MVYRTVESDLRVAGSDDMFAIGDAAATRTADGIVYPQVVRPGVQPRECTSDARPHTYLLAMQRDSLPEDFTLRVNKEVPPNSVGGIADVKTPVHQSR